MGTAALLQENVKHETNVIRKWANSFSDYLINLDIKLNEDSKN